MRSLRAWFVRVGGLFRRGRREQELNAEIESHVELHTDDNLRAGMTPQEAHRAALLTFGHVEALKDGYRERADIPAAAIVLQDLRYGLRRLRRQPGATLLIAATLGLGVGANAAMLNLVDLLMFRTPAHVQHPERIVNVPGPGTYVRYRELRERLKSVQVAAYTRQTLSFRRDAGERAVRGREPDRAVCILRRHVL